MDFEIIDDGTITDVPGFYAGSAHCGIKKRSKKDDICIIYTPLETVCSAVFTTNKFAASPVLVSKEQLNKGRNIKAVVVNSGIANACTGEQGYKNAIKTIELTAKLLDIKKDEIIFTSTGIIGKQLPMNLIEKGLELSSKSLSGNGGHAAAKAILTTDKIKKEIAVKIETEGKDIIIGGIAKGSGMIEPNMATMLAFIATNIEISNHVLDSILKEGVNKSFNCITVDGCQSTNDMVTVQANGESKIKINKNSKYFEVFKEAMFFVLQSLAKKIVSDGEGITKFIEIKVVNSKKRKDACKIGKAIANSNLFKTAMYGEDLNWGRINAAIGTSDVNFNPNKIDIYIDNIIIVKGGIGVEIDQSKAEAILKNNEIKFIIDLNQGKEKGITWTSDLSIDYVKINAMYST